MEKRVNIKVESYVNDIKTNICNKVVQLGFENRTKTNELLQFVYDYDRLSLIKEDFVKRKRIKNAIPVTNRCNAMRANNEQCTRRRKEGKEFCGTHTKGTPHGILQGASDTTDMLTKKVEVYAKEIMGIVYYIDHVKNVYDTEDIMNEVENPAIIATYEKKGDTITIPEFGLV
jgi:hypothetical protein